MIALHMFALDTMTLLGSIIPTNPLGLIVILVVVLLLFGNRLPSLAKSLGKSVNEFKKGIGETGEDEDDDSEEPRRVKQDK